MMKCSEAAEKWDVTERWVTQLCRKGRIIGAVKEGRNWLLPEDTARPGDSRVKSGQYRKYRNETVVSGKFREGGTEYDSVLPLPVGISDYVKAQRDYYYVDKTLLIRDILDAKPFVTLFTRPRRFGKTLNMDMLHVFFEKTDEDNSVYFRDKKIWKCGEYYREYQGRYPVIFLTFKDVKYDNWEDARDKIASLLQDEYARHSAILEQDVLHEYERKYFMKIVDAKASDMELSTALASLSAMLDEVYGIAPVIIIDEYDTPIESGYSNNYYDKVIGFMRPFFSGAFKDNPHLSFGFMTGILRIAQESIFSGLNNLKVNSVLDSDYSEYFGFTKEEAEELLHYYGDESKAGELMEWYDGYLFGDMEVFNPWSVISYVDNNCMPSAYWVSTDSNEILDEILKNADDMIMDRMNCLLQGEKVIAAIDAGVSYPMLESDPAYVYSFLLAAGYLKAKRKGISGTGNIMCEISLPNKEIRTVYRVEILGHLKKIGMITQSSASAIEEALYTEDAAKLESAFSFYLDRTISFYDANTEGFYHGLLAGILATMDNKYKVLSNRESGDGRFDLALIPTTVSGVLPGFIIELKYDRNLSVSKLKTLAASTLSQISDKRYEKLLIDEGTKKVIRYGIAFSNKKVAVVKD